MRRTLFSSILLACGFSTGLVLACFSKSGSDTAEDDPGSTGTGGADNTGAGTGTGPGAGGDVAVGSGGSGQMTTGAGGTSSGTGGSTAVAIDIEARPTMPCPGLVLNQNKMVAAYATDQFVWNDAQCKERQSAMTRAGGGYVRQFV